MSSHKHPPKRRALCRLLSLILPDRISRRIFPSNPPVSPKATQLDTSNVLHVNRASTSPIPTDLSGSRANHHFDTPNVLYVDHASTPPISNAPPVSRATHHLDTSNVLHVNLVSSRDKRPVTINILPDDVLLQIFLFDRLTYLEDVDRFRCRSWKWYRLVHVCRRWRTVVFAWPNFLDLKLVCGPTTTVELWPPLQIIISGWNWPMREGHGSDAAIVHRNRVCEIKLSIETSQLQRLASLMQEPFPALTSLNLSFGDFGPAPALPEGFLGGSTPRLQSLSLESIAFPALPKLLLSTTHLVRLTVGSASHAAYISPEAMVSGLAASANLQFLSIGFESPLSRPDRESQRPPSPTRTVLPSLACFVLEGTSEYLEDFVARIDAPLLDEIRIVFFHPRTFDTPQFTQFVRRTPKFQALNEAHVIFMNDAVLFEFPTRTLYEKSSLKISCRKPDWQISSLVQYFASFFPSICMAESLSLNECPFPPSPSPWLKDIENPQWLEILRPFTTVKNFYLCNTFAPRVAPALQELVGARMLEVLPTVQNVYLEGLQPGVPILPGLGKFLYTRQLSGHPTKISRWVRIFDQGRV